MWDGSGQQISSTSLCIASTGRVHRFVWSQALLYAASHFCHQRLTLAQKRLRRSRKHQACLAELLIGGMGITGIPRLLLKLRSRRYCLVDLGQHFLA
jgi:hypothetical protein